MYSKDKVNRITLRLTDAQFEFVKSNADLLGISPSDFLRMVVNATMASTKAANDRLKQMTGGNNVGGIVGRENDKTDIDHFV